jgi:hypothetical protein
MARTLPNFFVIGAMRSATTTLCDALARHPHVYMSDPKELNFFSSDETFARGWDWYRSQFAQTNGKLAIGEGTTNYTKQSLYPRAAERLAKSIPEAKLIYIVRHPLQRILSHWLHLLRMGQVLPTIAEAIKQAPDMLDISLYWKQISAYRRFFSDDRIFVAFVDDLVASPDEVIAHCSKFLGLEPFAEVTRAHVHSNAYPDVGVDGKLLRLLRKIPGAQAVARLQPAAMRSLWRPLKKPQPREAQWPDELRTQVVCHLEPDTRQFLEFYGKPADFWQLT